MAEGVRAPGGQVAAGVYDNPDSPPPADPQAAPHGWVWRRGASAWAPAQRAPKPGTRRAGLPAGNYVRDVQISVSAAEQPGEEGTRDAGVGVAGEDPAPGWQAAGNPADTVGPGTGTPRQPGAGDSGKLNFAEVPQQVKDDIAGLAGLVATPILSLLQALDPYCGTVLAQNLEPVVDAALPLICRSEKIVKYFAEDQADWLLWGKLAMALKPVAQAIAEHHIFGTVRVVRDELGGITIERKQRGDEWSGTGDHLTPQPQPAYAA